MTHETIRLVIGDQYKDAVREILEPSYEVVSRPPPAPGDLCLVERSQFRDLREIFESIIEDERPRFYPIVLFRQRNPTGTVDGLNTDDRSLIDDVVTMPIDKQVFQRRLENLLIRRRYSIRLLRYHRRRHEQFEGLFDAIAEPAVVLDESDDIVQMNDLFCRLLGEPRESLFGCSIDSILPAEAGEKRIDTGPTPQENSDEWAVTIEDSDGETQYVKLSTRNVLHHGAEYTVLVMTDVSALCRRIGDLRRRLETVETPARTDSE